MKQTTYNKNCNSIVIFCYPPWAGGKFLINCLGISNNCYLQDIHLLRKQRCGNLSSTQKLDFLLKRLRLVKEHWTDLDLGCLKLFGNSKHPQFFYNDINEISYEKNLFFVVAHCPEDLKKYVRIWPNAKKIYLAKTNSFINWRLGLDLDFDRTPYPDLSQNFSDEQIQQIFEIDNVLTWEVDWYFDKEKFIFYLQKLYHQLELTDFNSELITIFHKEYMEKIEELRNVKKQFYFD